MLERGQLRALTCTDCRQRILLRTPRISEITMVCPLRWAAQEYLRTGVFGWNEHLLTETAAKCHQTVFDNLIGWTLP